MNPSSITRRPQALATAGQVTITPDPQDQRAWRVALTTSGEDQLVALTRVGVERCGTFVADWDADDVRTLTRLLEKFEAAKATVAQRETAARRRPWWAPDSD